MRASLLLPFHTVKQNAYGSARPGFLLVEALVGISIFAIFLMAVGTSLLYGQESTIIAGDRIRATSITQRALEAVRGVRDGSYSSLAAGTYGVKVGTNGMWSMVATPQSVTGSFTTAVTLTTSGSDWMRVSANTVWKRGYARSGAVLIATDLTNWRTTSTRGDWSSPTLDGSYAPGGNVLFSRGVIGGSILYVAAGNSVGLYIVNIADTTSPVDIASGFSIGSVAYDVALRGNQLYVVTADSNAELKVYNVANPASPTLVTSVNLQGSGRGRSLAITDQLLLVGMTQSGVGGENELYAYDISGTGSLSLVDSEDDSGDILAIAVSGTGVYIASTNDSYELRAFRIFHSGSLALASVPGYNLSDRTLDAQSIAVTGTSALLGTLRGSIQEMVMFNLRANVPAVSSPGPWYHEGSGSVLGVAMDPSRCVGFIAADSWKKAFQVVNVRDTSSLTELATYNSTTGKGRGVLYDPVRDRVVVLTEQSILIFRPAVSTGTCP